MNKYFSILIILIFFIASLNILAQDSTKSLAFKNNRPQRNNPYFYRPDLAYQIWQQFKLNQEANSGNSLAQHELGLRYLLGDGIPADTIKAVYWIRKAAENNLTAAKYNLGIMLINGIGISWDPFLAFKYFKSAAREGMLQAEYVLSILYTDNLIVKRDWNLAYFWAKRSADGDFKPAKEILPELEPRINKQVVDSLFNIKNFAETESTEPEMETQIPASIGLMFIDFDTVQDTNFTITDSLLLSDLKFVSEDTITAKLGIDTIKTLSELHKEKYREFLVKLSDNGSPEAQTILGKLYDDGIIYEKNLVKAASFYFRALRNDSPKSTNILWRLSEDRNFISKLRTDAKNGNSEAKFVWYGLTSIGFDNQITISDAMKLLIESAASGYIPALNELGLNYYSGRFINQDQNKAIRIWKEGELKGSNEATIRLLSAELVDGFFYNNPKEDFMKLLAFARSGSLLAQVTVAICYEQGFGIVPSNAESVKFFRYAAQRGSQFAYNELKRMYDELRPGDPDFIIPN